MPVDVEVKIQGFSAAQRELIAERASRLIAEELIRQELRKAAPVPRVRKAKVRGVDPDGVAPLGKSGRR